MNSRLVSKYVYLRILFVKSAFCNEKELAELGSLVQNIKLVEMQVHFHVPVALWCLSTNPGPILRLMICSALDRMPSLATLKLCSITLFFC